MDNPGRGGVPAAIGPARLFEEIAVYVQKNNQFGIQCQSRGAPECPQHGELCDSEEEAMEWVEDECWIPTGEGFICHECNSWHMRNLVSHRRDMVQEEVEEKEKDDEPTLDLEVGIDDQSG